ncbi:hypothetical protein ACFX1R_003322 [Malus domestica]
MTPAVVLRVMHDRSSSYYLMWFIIVTGNHFEVPVQIRKALRNKGRVLQPFPFEAICQFIAQRMKNLKENGGTREIVAVSDSRKDMVHDYYRGKIGCNH